MQFLLSINAYSILWSVNYFRKEQWIQTKWKIYKKSEEKEKYLDLNSKIAQEKFV